MSQAGLYGYVRSGLLFIVRSAQETYGRSRYMKKRITVTVLSIVIIITLLAMPIYAANAKVDMVDMHAMVLQKVKTLDEITDSYGRKYDSNVFAFDAREKGYVRYELEGKYASFSGTLIAADSTASEADMAFAIFADGEEVYSISNFTKQKDAQQIQIDLTGVNVLEFKSWEVDPNRWDSWCYITNGSFVAAKQATDFFLEWDNLSEVVTIDSACYSTRAYMDTDAYGRWYHDGYSFDAREGGYALYNLDGKYTSFSGYIFPQQEASGEASIDVAILADDKVVFKEDGIGNVTEAIYFELDVTDVKTLKVETSVDDRGKWDQTVFIGSSMLSKHAHTLGEWHMEAEVTCTEDGRRKRYCTVCGKAAKVELIEALGHTPDGTWKVEAKATCVDNGERIQLCTVCGDVALTERIAAGHMPGSEWTVLKAAKCTTAGKRMRKCSVCGEAARTEDIPATGHTVDEKWKTLSEATCTVEGEEVRYCLVCSEIVERQSVPVKPHSVSDQCEVLREATCSSEGWRAKVCTVCEEAVEGEPVPVADHEYGKWKKIGGSVWDMPILRERECENCGHSEFSESNAMVWVKPLVIGIPILALVLLVLIILMLFVKGLPLTVSGVRMLFVKHASNPAQLEQETEDSASKAVDSDDKKRKIGAVVVILTAIAMIGLLLALLGGRSYGSTIGKYVDAQFDVDAEAILDLMPKGVIDHAMEEEGVGREEFDDLIDDLNEELQDYLDDIERYLGKDWSVSYEIQSVEEMTGDDLEDLKEDYEKIDVKIKAARTVEIGLTIRADETEQETSMDIALIKVGRSWYLDIESMGAIF